MIDGSPGITPGEIGRILGIKSANMVPLTAVLRQPRLVVRQPLNGRSHGLVVTAAGADLAVAARATMRAHDAAIGETLPDEAREFLMRGLDLLWTKASASGAASPTKPGHPAERRLGRSEQRA